MCKTGLVETVDRLGSTSELVRSTKPLLAQLIKIQAIERVRFRRSREIKGTDLLIESILRLLTAD